MIINIIHYHINIYIIGKHNIFSLFCVLKVIDNQLFWIEYLKNTLEYRLKVNSVCYGVFKISVCVPESIDAGFNSVPVSQCKLRREAVELEFWSIAYNVF